MTVTCDRCGKRDSVPDLRRWWHTTSYGVACTTGCLEALYNEWKAWCGLYAWRWNSKP